MRIFSGQFFGWGLIFMLAFAAVPALLTTAIGRALGKKASRTVGAISLGFFFVLYSVQTVYYGAFGKFMIIYSFFGGGATQIVGDGVINNALTAVLKGIPAIIILSVPFVLFFVLKKRLKSLAFKLNARKEPPAAPSTPQRIKGIEVFISRLPFFLWIKSATTAVGIKNKRLSACAVC